MVETAAEARTKPGTSGPDEKAVEDARLAAGTLLAWLSSEAFPADRELLVASARKRHAPVWLTDSLGGLPAGIVFQKAEQLANVLRAERRVRIVDHRSTAGPTGCSTPGVSSPPWR